MTYDCISDCPGRDSILMPRSACDGGIARGSDGEIEGLKCAGRSDSISVCGGVGAAGREGGMCAAHV